MGAIIRHRLGFRRLDAMRLAQNLPCFADASHELGIAHQNIFVERDLMTLTNRRMLIFSILSPMIKVLSDTLNVSCLDWCPLKT